MTKKKGGNYWRSRIKAEKNNNKRFRGRLRSKGEKAIKKRSSGKQAPKSGKWAQQIRAERKGKTSSKSWHSRVNPVKAKRAKKASPNKKLTKLRGNIQKAKRNIQLKGRQAFPSPTDHSQDRGEDYSTGW